MRNDVALQGRLRGEIRLQIEDFRESRFGRKEVFISTRKGGQWVRIGEELRLDFTCDVYED